MFWENEYLKLIGNEVAKYLTPLLVGLLLPKLIALLKPKQRNEKAINEQLMVMLVKLDASRTYYYKRHIKNDKAYISMEYEYLAHGVDSAKENSKEMPMEQFNGLVLKCEKENGLIIETDKVQNDYIRGNLTSKGVKVMALVPYWKSSTSKLYSPKGYVGVSWGYEVEISAAMLNKIREHANVIGFLVNN